MGLKSHPWGALVRHERPQDQLARLVKERRDYLGLTQHQVADRGEFKREWLSSVEQGRMIEPNDKWLLQLGAILLIEDPAILVHLANQLAPGEPPTVKLPTLSEWLRMGGSIAENLERRADQGDPEARAEL